MIDDEAAILGDTSKVFVGGYSQGCILSLATFFLYPNQLGGIVGLSAGNRTRIDFSTLNVDKKRLTPILVYLGEKDYIFNFEKT